VYLRLGPFFERGAKLMTIFKDMLDKLLKGSERPEDLLGDARLVKELKILLIAWMPG
jgi:hypothetical protein